MLVCSSCAEEIKIGDKCQVYHNQCDDIREKIMLTENEIEKLLEILENFIEAKVTDMNSEHIEDTIHLHDMKNHTIKELFALFQGKKK